ncbi:alpha/beta fold hydrolase [Salinibacter grassmerensis]|uniref:alpha/beta fold hydrolase n=1 Tax=Salinibacter grassmerensis TaxID=3040353 RepID=UPI0021E7BBE8|nr:alpha/beta hydrolase [Salinibacter grassmerensis]
MPQRNPAEQIPVPLDRRWVQTRGVQLHVRVAGPRDGPLVVLLHGFPEFWYGWRRQIPALAEAGYRVVVPDQRGYNRSEAPRAVAAYDLEPLVDDVCAVIDATGHDRASVVGHDWGAMVAWHLAHARPERLRRLAVLNVPHPHVFRETLRTSPAQLLRSTYALFFQVPGLPEWLLGRNDGQGLATMLRWSGHPGTFTEADLAAYRRAWRRPGRLRGMLNWYRAAARRALRSSPPSGAIDVPALVVWGAQDIALSRQMAAPSAAMCTDGRLRVLDDATHWVQHDAPTAVNRLLLDHLET